MFDQRLVQRTRHLRIDRRHHLLTKLQQRDGDASLMQGIHHLQADEAAPDHGGVMRLVMSQRGQYAIHIGDVAQ